MRNAVAGLLVTGMLAAVACKPKSSAERPSAASTDASEARPGLAADAAPVRDWDEVWPVESTRFADLVPADALFVWVNEEPLPDAGLDALAPFTTPFLTAFHDALREEDDEEAQRLLEEIGPRLDGDALRRLGIDPNPRVLIYTFAVAPVMRISLADPGKVEAWLKRDTSRNATLSNFHGQEFWELSPSEDDGEAERFTALAINGGDLVLTTFPLGFEDELLPLVFGQRLPEQKLWDTGFLEQAEREFGLLPHYLFRANLPEVFALMTGNAGGRSQAIAAGLGVELRNERCVEDLLRVTESMPALYWGVRGFGQRTLDTAFVLDIDDDSAVALAKLAGPIPGHARRPPDNAHSPRNTPQGPLRYLRLSPISHFISLNHLRLHTYPARRVSW